MRGSVHKFDPLLPTVVVRLDRIVASDSSSSSAASAGLFGGDAHAAAQQQLVTTLFAQCLFACSGFSRVACASWPGDASLLRCPFPGACARCVPFQRGVSPRLSLLFLSLRHLGSVAVPVLASSAWVLSLQAESLVEFHVDSLRAGCEVAPPGKSLLRLCCVFLREPVLASWHLVAAS